MGRGSEVPRGRLRVLWASIPAPAGSALHTENHGSLDGCPASQARKLSRGPQGVPRGSSQPDDSPTLAGTGARVSRLSPLRPKPM